MNVLASLIVAQALVQGVQAPVLEFPEAGLDDPAAYQGYATRFFRDSRRNAFQIYLDTQSGRVVHLWADAANASAAFTVRDTLGRPAAVRWGGSGAAAGAEGGRRAMRHRLAADLGALEIGWFLLGTMRQERDLQYSDRHRRPYTDPPFILPELTDLIASLERLPAGERARHLELLDARSPVELRTRLEPRITLVEHDTVWVVRVEQVTLDGRNRMTLELRGHPGVSTARVAGTVVSVQTRRGGPLEFDVTATTDAAPLTPLDRGAIFNPAFEAFYARQRGRFDSLVRILPPAEASRDPRLTSFRRLDREVRALELLSSADKLMAGLPNFATYFGRDMMMAALMLEPIASVDLQEHVIAAVIRKIAPSGDVSHEEALGGQAIREAAAEYAALIRAWEAERRPDSAAALLQRARGLLEGPQTVRENYRMIDDDFQLAVLVDRYLARADVPPERKRRFLSGPGTGGMTRLEALYRNLALVAQRTRSYAEDPRVPNLVGFLHRDDDGWIPGSWRDSRAGYGNGRFAMDVNVVWVPNALEAAERILQAVGDLALPAPAAPWTPAALRAAITTWAGARRHFEVRLEPAVVRRRVDAALAALSGPAREYWGRRWREVAADPRPLSFLALALDSASRAIPAANTDPATDLFLEDYTGKVRRGEADPAAVLEMLDVFVRRYPVGLLIEGVGPVVVNDAYADSAVRAGFSADPYHSPRVVWGREVNLLFLGLARQIRAAPDAAAVRAYVDALRRILDSTRQAVEASGLRHNELWSYRIEGDTLRPMRYGSSSDIQLWNVTDLAVRFLLDGLPPR